MFQYAKSQCEKLVVGVIREKPGEKLRSLENRLNDLKIIQLIDELIVYDSLQELLVSQKPDSVYKGNEFRYKDDHENQLIKNKNIELFFMSGDEQYDIKIQEDSGKNIVNKYLSEYRKKYSITDVCIKNAVNKFSSTQGLVIGDLIYDRYVVCYPKGMSQEDKNIVFEKGGQREFIGGAGIVAAHCNGLGSKTEFVSVIGDDEKGKVSEQNLNAINVSNKLILEEGRNTIQKTRYIHDNRPVFRVSVLESRQITEQHHRELLNYLEKKIKELDYIIISDFNYGLLSSELCYELIKLSKQYNVPISVDCQTSSQTGDLNKYRGVNLATPTEVEARNALRDFDSGIAYLGEKLRDKLEASHLILKLGADGALIFSEDKGAPTIEKLPALKVGKIVDPSGAGDSMLAVASLILSQSNNIYLASYLAAVAAGVQVGRRGNLPLDQNFWSFS